MKGVRFTGDPAKLQADIAALDLDPIKFKLMDSDEGQGWSREKVDDLEKKYKNFLFLSVTADQAPVPTKEIDTFWHAHILDTMKYAADCQQLFGFFLHHFPYFGMRGAEDKANLNSAFERTNELYEQTYGEQYARGADSKQAGSCGPANCSCTDCIPDFVPDLVIDGPQLLAMHVRPRLAPIH